MDEDVIEIRSSPEPGPSKGKKKAPVAKNSLKRRTRMPSGRSFIEISDTEGSEDAPRKAEGKARATASSSRAKTNAVASSSKNKARLAVAKPKAALSAAGSPQRTPSPPPDLPIIAPEPFALPGPLFLPEPDAEEPAPRPLSPVPLQAPEPAPMPLDVPIEPNPPDDPVAEPVEIRDADPLDGYISAVLEIIPNVQPDHLRGLIELHMPTRGGAVVDYVLHLLFEDPSYPKADLKGKRKRKEASPPPEERVKQKPKIDYASKDRQSGGGPHYDDMSIDQLTIDFPYIPKPHVRKTFFFQGGLYAPAHIWLAEEAKGPRIPYKKKTQPSRVTGKGRAREDAGFAFELEWIQLRNSGGEVEVDVVDTRAITEEAEDDGEGIECGCCFSAYPFSKLVQCPDAHLFCQDCITAYASGLLGAHDTKIVCMDQDGCKLPFPESELIRVLDPKLVELYHRVKQREEIEAAGIEGLEECPFCEYKVVIENEDEKLFRCENNECMVISCRECKKEDHLPRSCKEMEEDRHLDGRHAVEEAMTRALMRNCPKCQKGFVKEAGCNKMTCPNCATLSCYVCRQIITGYDHFANPPPYNGPKFNNKCQLWDQVVEQRHADEVNAAAKKAMDDYKRDHPDLEDGDINVQLAPQPPAAAPAAYAGYHLGVPMYNPAARAPNPPLNPRAEALFRNYMPRLMEPVPARPAARRVPPAPRKAARKRVVR